MSEMIYNVIIYILLQERKMGQRLNIIIIAEGAIDMEGNAITPDMVKTVSSPGQTPQNS